MMDLTPRESEVLKALVAGKTAKEISLILGIRRKTVYRHISSIKVKLNAGNREEAIAHAFCRGILKVDQDYVP